MASSQVHQQLLQFLTPELRMTLIKETESALLRIVRTNFNTQYALKGPLLAEFRNATSAHRSASDAELVEDFRRCVPLSDYDAYKPFMAAFNASPCKEAEVQNLFAPGLPYVLAISSGTSGKEPKIFPRYYYVFPKFSGEGPVAAIYYYGYRDLKHVEREPGHTVKKIIVSSVSSGTIREMLGWTDVDEDDSRMSTIVPGCIAPFAASMIANHKSFLVSSIKHGTIPDLPGVSEVRPYLQVHLHANPDRAAELSEIGPPSSCKGWAARVWPKLRMVRSIIGPTIAIHPSRYVSTECLIGLPFRPGDLHTYVLRNQEFVEFLDVTAEESHESLLQAWELEVGKRYEVVLTTGHGLWRYRLGDVIEVVGFDPSDGLPVVVLSGRRSLEIRLAPVLVSDSNVISAIQGVRPDVMQINEFTTVLDDREAIMTVGYLIEPAGTLGLNAHLTSLGLSRGLGVANTKFRMALQDGRVRSPSVRILRPGTFAAFRQGKAESMTSTGPGQMKVPAILLHEASRKWILERVESEI